MPYYKYRYTLDDEENKLWDKGDKYFVECRLFMHFESCVDDSNMEMYFNLFTKATDVVDGKRCIYSHFKCDISYHALMKRKQRCSVNYGRRGKLSNFLQQVDVKDELRFFASVWHGKERINFVNRPTHRGREILPKNSTLDEMLEYAKSNHEELRQVKAKVKKRTPLFQYLDCIKDQLTNEKVLFARICDFYKENQLPANIEKIKNFHQTALWEYNLQSFDETFEKHIEKNHKPKENSMQTDKNNSINETKNKPKRKLVIVDESEMIYK